MRKSVIFLLGPTASGKTEVANALSAEIPIEIISADSLQVYKYLDIGTAKPEPEWRRRVKHHFVDILEPRQTWSAGEFYKRVLKLLPGIWKKEKVPLVVGGGTLYVRALTDGLCQAPGPDRKVRQRLYRLAGRYGKRYLYGRLKKADPEITRVIHPSNLQRIVRALEVYLVSGVPFSAWRKQAPALPWESKIFGIQWERDKLYDRINRRVDKMIEDGLVDETKRIMKSRRSGNIPALQGLGYRQAVGYLKGKYDHSEMIRLIKRDTRRYAKRQYTWWKKDDRIRWIPADEKRITRVPSDIIRILKKDGFKYGKPGVG